MDSDSDSSDDNMAQLREAVDHTRLGNDLYQAKSKENSTKDLKELKILPTETNPRRKTIPDNLPSLRRDKTQDVTEKSNQSDLEVTPQFQKFVSSQLSKLLDCQIDECENNEDTKKPSQEVPGIKLLKSSQVCVNEREQAAKAVQKQLRRKRKNSASSEEDEEKLQEAALSGEMVLAQVGVYNGEDRFKARIEEGEHKQKEPSKSKLRREKKKKKLQNKSFISV